LLQAFLECHQPITSMGCRKEVPLCWHFKVFIVACNLYRVVQKEVYTFKNLFYKYYWTYGDMHIQTEGRNLQRYFHTLQALDMSPTCDVADVKSIIQLFPHLCQ
jgi:hypothetical protein